MSPNRGIYGRAKPTGLEIAGLLAIDGVPLSPTPIRSYRNKSIRQGILYT